MHRPEHLTTRQERRLDRLEDCRGRGRAPQGGGPRRSDRRRDLLLLARPAAGAAPIDGDDEEEIRATLGLIEARVRFGIHERLRAFLLPLVAAVERQIEEAEKDIV